MNDRAAHPPPPLPIIHGSGTSRIYQVEFMRVVAAVPITEIVRLAASELVRPDLTDDQRRIPNAALSAG